jgi:predicted phage baseplate assembly protein
VAAAERTIPLVLRHQNRLVTQDDFRDLTLQAPGVDVGRVEVLPLFRPTTPPQTDAAGIVTLLVLPRFDTVEPLWPTPDRRFLRRVCEYLDAHRLITTELYVRGPQYVSVYVSVGIVVQAGFFADDVQANVQTALRFYLAALPPGGPFGGGWPLGRKLLKKDLEAHLTRVPGVEYVDGMELGVESPTDIPEYPLSGLQLPRLAGLSVIQGTAEPLAQVFGPKPPTPPSQIVLVPVSKSKC